MSTAEYLELARRVCDRSKSICNLLTNRVPIEPANLDSICRQDKFETPPTLIRKSMGVEQMLAHFANLDVIDAAIDDWVRSGPNANKLPSKGKKLTKKPSLLSLESEVGLEESVACIIQTPEQSSKPQDEVAVKREDIVAFNSSQFGTLINVNELCAQDKQKFRPIFKHVPKLQEFVLQIEAVVEKQDRTSAGADDPQMTDLLNQLCDVVLKTFYL